MTLTDDEKNAIELLMIGKHDYFHCANNKFFIGQVLADTDNMLTPEGTLKDAEFCEILYRSILHHAFRMQIVMGMPSNESVGRLVKRLIMDIEALDKSAKEFDEFNRSQSEPQKEESLIIQPG